MRKRLAATLVAGALTAMIGLPLSAAAPAQAAGTATVTIVHGVPGLTVDVYANGQKLLTGFKPGIEVGEGVASFCTWFKKTYA